MASEPLTSQAAYVIDTVGSLVVDQTTIDVNEIIVSGANDLTLDVPTGQSIDLQVNDVDVLSVNGTTAVFGTGGTNYSLPLARGAVNQILSTNASGVASWGGHRLEMTATVTEGFSLAVGDSGKIIKLGVADAGQQLISLPTATTATGVYYTFVTTAVSTGTWEITSFDAVLYSSIHQPTAATLISAGSDNIIAFVASSVAGSVINVWCDGANWFVHGMLILIISFGLN